MTFAHPLALLWGLLAIPLVLLYRRKIAVRREPVATNFLWQQALAEERGRRDWHRWRDRVSLAVHLAALLLIVLAMAEPLIPGPRQFVLVIDNSASMNAVDVEPTRLDRAKQAAKDLVGQLRDCDRLAVLTAGDSPGVRCTLTGNRSVLNKAIDSVAPSAGPTRVAEAADLAGRLLGASGGKKILLTDACFPEAAALAGTDDVELIRVGTSADNLAVSRLAARRVPADPARYEILAEVASFASKSVDGPLKLADDDQSVATETFAVAAGDRSQQIVERSANAGGHVTAKLDYVDALAADNIAWAEVPPSGILRVVLVSDDGAYLRDGLQSNPRVELTVVAAAPSEVPEGAILIFDGNVPSNLPNAPVFAVNPAGSSDLWQMGEALADATIARQTLESPVLSGVDIEQFTLPGARRLELAPAVEASAEALALTADGEPLAYLIDRPVGRVIVLSGNLAESSLPLSPGFADLVVNMLDWLAGPQPTVDAEPSPVALAGLPESDVRVPQNVGTDVAEFVADVPGPAPWLYLAVIAGLLIVVEWCLYQRRWLS